MFTSTSANKVERGSVGARSQECHLLGRTSTADGEQILTRKEAAALLKVSEKTLSRLPIHVVDLGYRTRRYRLKDLPALIDRRTL